MTETITKADILKAVAELPDNATLEDAIERLAFLHRIEVGLQQARLGQGMTQTEAKMWFRNRVHNTGTRRK
ncbi:MAG TPA: hypothetical protein VFG50_06175 [Rhodothermales bacterium]|nr:hypothetical protein [Rhodothermales bacterium]